MTTLSRTTSPAGRQDDLVGLTSPPGPGRMSRRASDVSSAAGPSPSLNGGVRKPRAGRNRLRDYYGLTGATPKGDPMDPDSTAFNPDTYFEHLANNASLPELLKRENELLTEIRELDGERQSLVYNHHHELIEASDTIRKMKSRAEALDASLDSLKASFQSISQLSASLAPPPRLPSAASSPTITPATPTRPKIAPSASRQSTPTRPLATLPEQPPSPAGTLHPDPPGPTLDPLLHLPALLALPILLRAALASPAADERAKADALWGTWEPALRSWEDEGVAGVKDLGQECREILREGRRASSGGGSF